MVMVVSAASTSAMVSTSPVQFTKWYPSSASATRLTTIPGLQLNVPSLGMVTDPPGVLEMVRV